MSQKKKRFFYMHRNIIFVDMYSCNIFKKYEKTSSTLSKKDLRLAAISYINR